MTNLLEGHWEFEGKKQNLPKGLKYRIDGGFDSRYSVVKEFLADKRWKFIQSPVVEYYANKFFETMTAPSIFSKWIK